jgi:hypothetical protein
MAASLDLRAINRSQFASAKRYWAGALLMKVAVFAAAAASVFCGQFNLLPQIVLGFVIASELLQTASDAAKSRAETLLRILDECRSFGRQISEADKRDIALSAPKALRERMDGTSTIDSYFESASAPGPRRAIDNLLESAWYTRHQAFRMMQIYVAAVCLSLLLSIFALFIAARASTPNEADRAIKLVTGWLMLAVSLNPIKGAWSYFRMSQRCGKTEDSCSHLLGSEVSEADAIRRWNEYHVARAGAPLLPGWLWGSMEQSLNVAWRARAQ